MTVSILPIYFNFLTKIAWLCHNVRWIREKCAIPAMCASRVEGIQSDYQRLSNLKFLWNTEVKSRWASAPEWTVGRVCLLLDTGSTGIGHPFSLIGCHRRSARTNSIVALTDMSTVEGIGAVAPATNRVELST